MSQIRIEAGNLVVKGIIIPAKWDAKGNVVAVAISTHGEEEYLICNDSLGRTLFGFIHELVQVKGRFKNVEGVKCLEIMDVKKCPVIFSDALNASRKAEQSC
jgi:hypothetical protein